MVLQLADVDSFHLIEYFVAPGTAVQLHFALVVVILLTARPVGIPQLGAAVNVVKLATVLAAEEDDPQTVETRKL
jgi:hypothetical protein